MMFVQFKHSFPLQKNSKYLIEIAELKAPEEILPFWLPTGKDCDLVQAACEPSARHKGCIYSTLDSMWHFFTLSLLPIFEETHTGDLIKICRSLWWREDALMWTGGREWMFYLLGIWWFYFIGTYKGKRRCWSHFKWTAMCPLLENLSGQGKV